LSTHVRRPDFIFQPWEYGEKYSKATCIWSGGGFVMPEPSVTAKPLDVEQTIWRMPPSEDRGDLRSITSAGFSRAVFEANCAARAAVPAKAAL
jgi:hypothetical protein